MQDDEKDKSEYSPAISCCDAFALPLLLGSAGCNDLRFGDAFLEKAPGVDVTIDTIFSSKLYADRALVSAYSTMRCGWPVHNSAWPLSSSGRFNNGGSYDRACSQLDNDNFDSITDLMESHNDWSSGGQEYANGNYSADAEDGVSWTKMGFVPDKEYNWVGIRRAFLYIENVDKVPDMTAEEKSRGKGEAYVIIASHYLDLFRNYGGIPLLKSSVDAANVMSYDFSRKTAEETLDYIVELCDKAAPLLPWTETAERNGHFTKAAAMGLKCRALLFAASPVFNSSQPYSAQTPTARRDNANHVASEDIPKMYWFGGTTRPVGRRSPMPVRPSLTKMRLMAMPTPSSLRRALIRTTTAMHGTQAMLTGEMVKSLWRLAVTMILLQVPIFDAISEFLTIMAMLAEAMAVDALLSISWICSRKPTELLCAMLIGRELPVATAKLRTTRSVTATRDSTNL